MRVESVLLIGCLLATMVGCGPQVAADTSYVYPEEYVYRPFATLDIKGVLRHDWKWLEPLGGKLTSDKAVDFLTVVPDELLNNAELRLVCVLGDPAFPYDWERAEARALDGFLPKDANSEGVVKGRINEPFFTADYSLGRIDNASLIHVKLENIWLGPAGDRFLAGFYITGKKAAQEKQFLFPLILTPCWEAEFPVALQTAKVGNVFVDEQPCELELYAFRTSREINSTDTVLEITNLFTGKKHSIPVSIRFDNSGVWHETIDLSLTETGVFDVSLYYNDTQLSNISVTRLADLDGVGDASPFGINLFQQQLWSYTFDLELMAKAGIKWIRPWLRWENCWGNQEPFKGVWNWNKLDTMLDRCDQFGLNYQYVFYGAPQRVYQGSVPWGQTLQDNTEWEEYVKTIVARYQSRIAVWETWNEPCMHYTPEELLPLSQVVDSSIRSVTEEAVHLGVGGVPTEYLKSFASQGGLSYCDAISTHLYLNWPADGTPGVNPEKDLERELWSQRLVLLQYQLPEKRIWLNETAYSATKFDSVYTRTIGVTELEQAQYLVRSYLISLATGYVDKVFWFCTIDPRDSKDAYWDAVNGVLYFDRTPKMAYAALAAMTKQMKIPEFIGQMDVPYPNRVYAWNVDGEVLLTAWAEQDEVSLELQLTSESLIVFDMMGNPLDVVTNDGIADIPLSGNPIYIHGLTLERIKDSLMDYRVQIDSHLSLLPEETNSLIIGFTGVTTEREVRIRTHGLEDIMIEPEEIVVYLKPQEESSAVFDIQATREHTVKPLVHSLEEGIVDIEIRECDVVFASNFEDGEDWPEGWASKSNNPHYSWSNDGHSGDRSFHIKYTAGPWGGTHSSKISVKPDTLYSLSFWGKYDGTGLHGARALIIDANGWKPQDHSVLENNSGRWKKVERVFRTGENTTEVHIKLERHGWDKDGDVWFDDVYLVELSQ